MNKEHSDMFSYVINIFNNTGEILLYRTFLSLMKEFYNDYEKLSQEDLILAFQHVEGYLRINLVKEEGILDYIFDIHMFMVKNTLIYLMANNLALPKSLC